MAKKTWVKVKRGLLTDPKHRIALGNRLWLYLYMLDVADWDSGKVIQWIDRAAADDMQMPLSTIRTQRRELEDAGYISCHQHKRRQTITIKRWVNPREYGGKVYNDDTEEWDYAESDQETEPLESPKKSKGDNKGYNKGDNKGAQKTTPLHINHISHTTTQYGDQKVQELSDQEKELYFLELFSNLSNIDIPVEMRRPKDYMNWVREVGRWVDLGVLPEDVENAIAESDKKLLTLAWPGSITKMLTSVSTRRKRGVSNNGGVPKHSPDARFKGSDGKTYNAKGEIVEPT